MSRSFGGTALTTRSSMEIVPPLMPSEPGDHPERGRLPAPRRPDEHDELAVLDVEVELGDGERSVRVLLRHVIQHDLGHRSPFGRMPERIGQSARRLLRDHERLPRLQANRARDPLPVAVCASVLEQDHAVADGPSPTTDPCGSARRRFRSPGARPRRRRGLRSSVWLPSARSVRCATERDEIAREMEDRTRDPRAGRRRCSVDTSPTGSHGSTLRTREAAVRLVRPRHRRAPAVASRIVRPAADADGILDRSRGTATSAIPISSP